jgi:hypothetical protein
MTLFMGVHCEIRKGLIRLITGWNQHIFAIRAVALVSFYFATRQSYKKQQTLSIFFQKLFHHFSFSLCRYPIVHTFTLPKDSQEDLVNLSMLTQSSSSLRWGHMTHACGGAISLLR